MHKSTAAAETNRIDHCNSLISYSEGKYMYGWSPEIPTAKLSFPSLYFWKLAQYTVVLIKLWEAAPSLCLPLGKHKVFHHVPITVLLNIFLSTMF